MDPDQCLKEIRELLVHIRRVLGYSPSKSRTVALESALEDLTERVDALDEWCTKQGFLPAAWRETKPLLKKGQW